MVWERYMQTEGLNQHVCCQHITEKQITEVTSGKIEQQRQLVCFCTNCWSFTSKHHSKDTRASFIEHCPMQKKNIHEGFGDRSLTTSWINSERIDFNFERQEDQTGATMSIVETNIVGIDGSKASLADVVLMVPSHERAFQ